MLPSSFLHAQSSILLHRIFQLVADINGGVLFFLLPTDVFLISLSLYTMEHVNNYFLYAYVLMYKILMNFFHRYTTV